MVQVWPKAIPQYMLGYGRFKDIADDVEHRNAGLLLAGTYRDGVSLGEAIGSGERAASRVAQLVGAEAMTAGSTLPAHTGSSASQD
jgi:oxygen-dependent protoporphyrinogen oxidase